SKLPDHWKRCLLNPLQGGILVIKYVARNKWSIDSFQKILLPHLVVIVPGCGCARKDNKTHRLCRRNQLPRKKRCLVIVMFPMPEQCLASLQLIDDIGRKTIHDFKRD